MRVVVRQPARNPRRTILTFLGLVIAFFLYTMLESVLATLDQLVNSSAETLLVIGPRNDRGGLQLPKLPRSYVAQVRDTEGVIGATPVRVFVGFGRNDTQGVFALGVEVDTFFDVNGIEGVTDEAKQRMRSERSGAIAGALLLEVNEWKVGDRVMVSTPGRGPSLSVELVGEVPKDARLSNALFINLDYLEGVLGDAGRVAFIQGRIERPEYAAPVSRRIDARFRDYTVPTETRSEKAHMASVLASLSEVLAALQAIGFLTLGVTVLVVGNSVSMSVRERTVEIGTLRALGFSKVWILGMIVGESVLVSMMGGLAGGGLGAGLVHLLKVSGATLPGDVPLNLALDPLVILQVLLLSIPVGAVAAAQPVIGAIRMPIANALRFAN